MVVDPPREREARRDGDQHRGDHRDRPAHAAAASERQAEREQEQRDQREEVALLETPARRAVGVRREEHGLEKEARGEADGQRGERTLDAWAGPREDDERARNDEPAGGVGEEHRVDREPVEERPRVDVEVRDPRVVANALGGDRDRGEREEAEGELQAPKPRPGDERREDERDREHDELDPREGREPCERDEAHLVPARGPVERADADVDRAEHERVGDRLREDVGDVEEVGHEDGEHRGREREAPGEVEPSSEQEDRHRGEGHRDGVQRLRQAQRDARVAEEPERCGEDRLEEGREARGVAADRRPARRRQLVRERRVDVLVGEEERGRMGEREQEADQRAHPDDPREQGEGRERERHRPRGNAHAAGYDVHSGHLPAIGSGLPALENDGGRGLPRPPSASSDGRCYGPAQAVVVMSPPGPCLYQDFVPTELRRQYETVFEVPRMTTFLTPWS